MSLPTLAFLTHDYTANTLLADTRPSPYDADLSVPATASCVTGFSDRSAADTATAPRVPTVARSSLTPWQLTDAELSTSAYELLLIADAAADSHTAHSTAADFRPALSVSDAVGSALSQSLNATVAATAMRSVNLVFVNFRVQLCRHAHWLSFGAPTEFQSYVRRQLRLIATALLWTLQNQYDEERRRIKRENAHNVEAVEQHQARRTLDALCARLTEYTYETLIALHAAARALMAFNPSACARALDDTALKAALAGVAACIERCPVLAEPSRDARSLLRPPRQLSGALYERLLMSLSDASGDLHSHQESMLIALRTVRAMYAIGPDSHAIGLLRMASVPLKAFHSAQPHESILAFHGLDRAHPLVAIVQTAVSILHRLREDEGTLSLDDGDRAFVAEFVQQIALPALDDAAEGPANAAALMAHAALELTIIMVVEGVTAESLLERIVRSTETFYRRQRPRFESLRAHDGGDEKAVADWTSDEWREMGLVTCEALTLSVKNLSDECAAIDFGFIEPSLSVRCAASIVRCFASDVSDLLKVRSGAASSGLDEISLAAVSAVGMVRQHLLTLESHIEPSSRALVMAAMPDLAHLARLLLSRWLGNQADKAKHSFMPRLLSDAARISEPIGEGVNHAPVVVDLFGILSGLVTAFFGHLALLAPHGATELPRFLGVLDECILDFSRALVSSCGSALPVRPVGGDHLKLKQSVDSTEAGRGVALFRQSKSTQEKAEREWSQITVIDPTDPNSIASQTVPGLCVHVASLQGTIDALNELRGQCANELERLCHRHPVMDPSRASGQQQQMVHVDVGPKPTLAMAQRSTSAIRPATSTASRWGLSESELASALSASSGLCVVPGVSEARWLQWGLSLPEPAPKLAVDGMFAAATAQLHADRAAASRLLADYLVYVQWRDLIFHSLYSPSVKAGARVRGGALHAEVNRVMPTIYQLTDADAFRVIAEQLLHELSDALIFLVLYGRRVCEAEDSEVLLADIEALEALFGRELTAAQLLDATARYRRLLRIIQQPTDVLIQQCEAGTALLTGPPFDAQSLVRVIGLRQGRVVDKFMLREREKQKKRQGDRTSGSSPLPVPLSASAGLVATKKLSFPVVAGSSKGRW